MFAITPPGGPEWIIILLVFVLLFGAKKLPELGSSVGKSIKNFKRGLGEGKEDAPGEAGAAEQVTEHTSRNPEQ
ncbi:MAG TPA: twin-arginine translocase TatA/TatE family subunit [Egibacteraceae bacterium]|nr:twin-arginine translocase TatA/TatE family subunit [Egibacteraceae bacterium]